MNGRVMVTALVAVLAFGATIAWGQAPSGPTRPANARTVTGAASSPRGATDADPLMPSGSQPLPASWASYDPCPAQDITLPDQGPSLAQPVSVPAVPAVGLSGPAAVFDPAPGEVPASYDGTILRPADTLRYRGLRPSVVLMHGIYGEQCQMWWLARYLAGAGYVTLTVTSPTPAERNASYGVAIDAARSAVHFLANPLDNPFGTSTDPSNIGIAGWSEGSVVASVVQGLPDMGAVRAIVALDDLRGSFLGDSGAPVTFCSPPVRAAVTPRAPALGFASDKVCDVQPDNSSPDLKLSGYGRWRAAGVPAVELPLAGYGHFDYDAKGPKLYPVGQLTRSWLDAWLGGRPSALAQFSLCQIDNLPSAGTLSSNFHSGVYLPSESIDTTTWAPFLAGRCAQDPSVVGTTPLR
ncbi:MAG: hypothetical protein M3063_11410 [Actinomycetota bacterium]|nr:hypothetical protein [Actinomycetota bacterium]